MRIINLLIIFLIGAPTISCQELSVPQISQYLSDNPFLMSPAYAGIGNYVKVRANGISQWVGIKDAPDTQSLSADVRLGNRSGIGMVLYNDSNGETHQRGGKVSFAHHLTIDRFEKNFLSLAFSFNLNQFRINVENLDDNNDLAIVGDKASSNPNIDLGFLYRKAGFYLGFNASNLLNKDFEAFNSLYEPNILRNYNLYLGNTFRKHPRNKFEFEPSAYIQFFESDKRSSTDLNAKFRWYNHPGFSDNSYLGITARFLNDQLGKPLYIAPILGIKTGALYFGISYQIVTNQLVSHQVGTFGATLGLDFFQGISNCTCTY